MKKENNIEDLFKEKFENFEADVNPSVWKNIQTALKGFGLGFLIKSLINKIGTNTVIAVVSSVATVISTVLVMNWASDKKSETVENKPTTNQVVVEQTIPTSTDNVVKEEVKPEVKNTIAEETKNSTATNGTITIKKDKKEMESVISKFSQKPVADIFASPIGGEVPLIVSLMNNGTGKVNKWSFGDSKKVETETSPVHIYNEPGIYKVKLTSTNAEGKTTVDSVNIEVVGNPSMSSAPTEISPDGDNNNEEFAINPINIKDMDVIIFDKNGTVVYQWEGIDGKWDGKNLKGKPANEGMYFYIINAVGLGGKKFEKTGSIRLTRKNLPK